MKKLAVGTFVAAFVSSAVLLSDGVATADDVVVVPGTAPPSGPAKKFYHFKPEWIPKIAGAEDAHEVGSRIGSSFPIRG